MLKQLLCPSKQGSKLLTIFLTNKSSKCKASTSFVSKKLLLPSSEQCNVIPSRKFRTNSTLYELLYYNAENNYIFSKLKDLNVIEVNQIEVIKTLKEFEDLLSKNYRTASASEIVHVFQAVKQFSIDNNICLSDKRYDNLVDGLMDNCEKLTDDELYSLLVCLCDLPLCESLTAHNFHDVWSCLDDMCCWRISTWNISTMFKFADVWYKFNMGKVCDFIWEVVNKLPKWADRLTKDELLRVFFYFNIMRKRNVDFEFEYALGNKIKEMNADEMAVVALGYFKSQTKIKLVSIMETMIRRVIDESKTIHEISLTAITKILRFSKPIKLSQQLLEMLDALTDEVPRLSNLCCLHITLIGTGIQLFHPKTLLKCSEKIVKDISDKEKVRLKDLERLLNSLVMFDFDPKTSPDIFQAVFKELHNPAREIEITKYKKCLPCALNYLSLRNIYSYELMDRFLDINYIEETYGKGAKLVPRELFTLDASIDIECPGYNGNRLPPRLKYRAVKWLTEYTPSHNQYKKLTAADKLHLDVIDVTKLVVKNDDLLYIDHILPHFPRADIVLCRDRTTGEYVKPIGFERFILGDVKFALNDANFKWYALVILGWNSTIKDSSIPLGTMIMKERQLKKIGYEPIFVIWNQYQHLKLEEKIMYIKNKLDTNK